MEIFLYCSSNFNGNGHLNTRTSTSMEQTSNDEENTKKILVFTAKYTENNNENKTIKQVRKRKKSGKTSSSVHCLLLHFNQPQFSCAHVIQSVHAEHFIIFYRSMTCLDVGPYRNNSSGAHLMTVTEVKKREKERGSEKLVFQVSRNGRNAISK